MSDSQALTLARIRDFAERLRNVVSPLKRSTSDFNEDLTFMGMGYIFKQDQHLQGILALGPHRDSILILRSMMEGWGSTWTVRER